MHWNTHQPRNQCDSDRDKTVTSVMTTHGVSRSTSWPVIGQGGPVQRANHQGHRVVLIPHFGDDTLDLPSDAQTVELVLG